MIVRQALFLQRRIFCGGRLPEQAVNIHARVFTREHSRYERTDGRAGRAETRMKEC